MSQERLNNSLLENLPAEVIKPAYDRSEVTTGIVHLGIGAFHRAHQAWYTENRIAAGETSWGIVGASLRSAGVRDQLVPQNGLYSVVEKSNAGTKVQIVGAVSDVLVGPESPQQLLELLAQESVRIVSLTITEKGYCHDPASGNLNPQHPDVVHDLANPQAPKSALGYIVGALALRKERGLPGFTVLSCDNLPSNGKLLGRVLVQYAEKVSAELAAWISDNTTTPATMVDRIVPATTDNDRAELEAILGCRDEAAVMAEPFAQWVVEDNFLRGRPEWDKAGATFVDEVEVYELIKLRLLNGSHSMLAYSGYLSGFETVADVMAEPAFNKLALHFMKSEATTSIDVPADFDIAAYQAQLIERFENRALRHRTWQIAMDGSQKIPQRWLGTLRHQLENGGPIEVLSFALANWIRYVAAVDEKGNAIEVSDPLAADLKALCDKHKPQGNDALATAFLAFTPVFGEDLRNSERLHSAVAGWLDKLDAEGTLACVQKHFSSVG
ncbi:mannitol dehydrogenase family protein [Microbulbifer harenosus]|uniref:Mannitol dehydrogenase family protein n=1 Tax=Microbulbifer harenosus TaxID=2576840 RepID=A0ABY2UJK7_9GAMM|nr:mannitol dehydrogenase family protein [Microbulbifer harenosus]TLM78217.1 mannitol dehydrogenase family protein [Microbulbifer harenosus]